MSCKVLFLTVIMASSMSWAEGHNHQRKVRDGEAMAEMPMIKPKRIYTVTGKENFDSVRGFGNHDGMAGMMTLMMVEGSGMEGMKMEPMSPNEELISDSLESSVKTAQSEKPKGGSHAMHNQPESVPSKLALKIETPLKPTVGKNKIIFSTGNKTLKLSAPKAKVEMTSMNMGVEEPKIKDLGDGRYELEANFGMAGPWRVNIEATQDNKNVTGEINFDVGSK